MISGLGLYNYWIVIGLMMIGLYTVIAKGNLVKKLMGLSIFQASVVMLYISFAVVDGGTAPILYDVNEFGGGHHGDDHAKDDHADDHGKDDHGKDDHHDDGGDHHGEPTALEPHVYANPLPHVLMLTAIVVGVATLSVGLALVVRIQEAYGTIEEDELLEADRHDGDSEDPGLGRSTEGEV